MILILRLRRVRVPHALIWSALLATAMSLAGCTAANVADHLPTTTGGLPQNAPPRPSTPAEYPAVHDMPPPRSSVVLSEEEQRKLEDELIAARKRAAAAAKAAGTGRSK